VPLQQLYLNNNGLGPHAGILIADALSELHAKKEEARKAGQQVPDLETVICGRNRLENGSMTAWAKTFSLHNRIKEIKMVQNGIRQEGIAHLLSEGLNHDALLEVLDLQDNTFTLLGARALAQVVRGWPQLIELGVGDSLLGAKGGVRLAEALAKGHNTKLQILRLQYNEITAAGVKALAEAAKALPALKKLELNGNKFAEDDESIIALQDLFEARKEEQAGDVVVEDDWGLDSLSDLEEESEGEEEEEEEEEEDVEPEERAEKLIKDAEEAQEEPVAQRKDKEVDELAEKLGKTAI
jgi:Ran GTPase-activating protein 1